MDVTQPPAIDLDAYFARIGYEGPRTPDMRTLRALIEHHLAAITFEAVDALLGRGIDISPAAVDAKLIDRRRGGYCFEQNGLFKRALATLGFRVEGLIARVLWMSPADAPLPDWSHMALRVTLDGAAYLVDVGFGSAVPTGPLRFDETGPQRTPHEEYRLTPTEDGYLLEVRFGDTWARVYEVSRQAQNDGAYIRPNLKTSTDSHFCRDLIAARVTPAARIVLSGNRLTIRRPDGTAERRHLSADELEKALRGIFDLPVEPSWRPILQAAAAKGAAAHSTPAAGKS